MFIRACAYAAALAIGTMSTDVLAEQHASVVMETVDNYAGCGTNIHGDECGAGFFQQIWGTGPNWAGFLEPNVSSPSIWYEDANVWDSDFQDPQLGIANADDNDNFDPSWGAGISFYSGHGINVFGHAGSCQTAANCALPPSGYKVGTSGYGTCVQTPVSWSYYGRGWGYCQYTPLAPYNIIPAIQTCGSHSISNNEAVLQNMALGETPSTEGWRGAGTNGGTSVAFVHMSYGMMTFFPASEWTTLFAGIHLYAGMVVSATPGQTSDVQDAVNWGMYIAQGYTTNPWGQVQQAYVNAISMENEGLGCPGSGSPNGGFVGCGCHMAMTISSTNSGAYAAFYENWFELTEDLSTQNGSGYWYYNAVCNYNPSTYPWSGGG